MRLQKFAFGIMAVSAFLCGQSAIAQVTTRVQTNFAVIDKPVTSHALIEGAPKCIPTAVEMRESFIGLNHMDRLCDMMEQVSLGSARGWLTSEELSALHGERDRIAAMINSTALDGLDTGEIVQIESALTVLNQQIAGELNDMDGASAGVNPLPPL